MRAPPARSSPLLWGYPIGGTGGSEVPSCPESLSGGMLPSLWGSCPCTGRHRGEPRWKALGCSMDAGVSHLLSASYPSGCFYSLPVLGWGIPSEGRVEKESQEDSSYQGHDP